MEYDALVVTKVDEEYRVKAVLEEDVNALCAAVANCAVWRKISTDEVLALVSEQLRGWQTWGVRLGEGHDHH